jgi:hypothetical protein
MKNITHTTSTAMKSQFSMGFFSRITIITIYQRLCVCRIDHRDNIMLMFACSRPKYFATSLTV